MVEQAVAKKRRGVPAAVAGGVLLGTAFLVGWLVGGRRPVEPGAPTETGTVGRPGPVVGSDTVDTEAWARVLRKYVDAQGLVAYAELKADRGDLDAYARSVARLRPSVYRGWTEKRRIAFWINAYNALTVQLIIDHYPIKAGGLSALRFPRNSIRQISGAWDKITFPVMGRPMTLDNIEHDTLRVDFNEPRIHIALVCAAKGCPALLRRPYRGETLEAQLDDRCTVFFSRPEYFRIDRTGNVVYLGKVLDWYRDDFPVTYGVPDGRFPGHKGTEAALLNFAGKYLSEADRSYLRTAEYDVKYLDYDWSLNEQAR